MLKTKLKNMQKRKNAVHQWIPDECVNFQTGWYYASSHFLCNSFKNTAIMGQLCSKLTHTPSPRHCMASVLDRVVLHVIWWNFMYMGNFFWRILILHFYFAYVCCVKTGCHMWQNPLKWSADFGRKCWIFDEFITFWGSIFYTTYKKKDVM